MDKQIKHEAENKVSRQVECGTKQKISQCHLQFDENGLRNVLNMNFQLSKPIKNEKSITTQLKIKNEKSGYILDKFNRPEERMQEIVIALYGNTYRTLSFNELYDLVPLLLEEQLDDLINNEHKTTLMSKVIDDFNKWLFSAEYDGTNDIKQGFKSLKKIFFKTQGEEVVAYPISDDYKLEILNEMRLYTKLKKLNENLNLNLILPNPKLIRNTNTHQYGIKMKYIEGKYIDVYNRGLPEIEDIILKTAKEFNINNINDWIGNAFNKIKDIIEKLNNNNIEVNDLQGILDKNGIWTIIDPLNVIVNSKITDSKSFTSSNTQLDNSINRFQTENIPVAEDLQKSDNSMDWVEWFD